MLKKRKNPTAVEEVSMQSTEADRSREFGCKHFLKQYNIFTDTAMFQVLEKGGRKAYNIALKYGPVYVNVLSSNLAKMCKFFSFPPFERISLALQNITQSRDEFLYLSGRAFFESSFGRFTINSLDICTYSFERLFKRLELSTKDTVIVFHSESHSPLKSLKNEIPNDTTDASPLMNVESTEARQPAPKIEPLTPALPSEKDESSAKDADPEKDSLVEFRSSSNRTIIYENVTGLEKVFVLLFDAFILCPVNAAVAFLRFLRIILRDVEECVYASKMNVTNSGRRVKVASTLNGTILMNRFETFYSDIVQPIKLDDSVLRLEYKQFVGLSGSNEEFLNKQMDSLNFYWEENDSDYEPMDQTSDTCTKSDTDISAEEGNGTLIIEKKQESPSLNSGDPLLQSKDKDNCSNGKELPVLKKRIRKRKPKSRMTKSNAIPDNPLLQS